MIDRRSVLLAGVAAALTACSAPTPASTPAAPPNPAERALADLENSGAVRLGVLGVDTGSGAVVAHRADERFLMCSTSKFLTVAAVLHARLGRPGLLDERIRYRPDQLVSNSPVTGAHVADGLTVADLCAAAITVSDNTAENLLLGLMGGPPGVTAYVRSIGDGVTRLDRFETALNDGGPGEIRDTSTSRQMADDMRRLALGDVLDPAGRDQLTAWLVANTTGGTRIRGGLPPGWRTGDKTGSGAQGEVQDVAVTWPPGRAPLVLAVYTRPADPHADAAPTVRSAATVVARALVPGT